MGVYETWSRRQKRLSNQGQIEVYQYTKLPEAFRGQIRYIWRDAIGPVQYGHTFSTKTWINVHDTIARAKGGLSISPTDWESI